MDTWHYVAGLLAALLGGAGRQASWVGEARTGGPSTCSGHTLASLELVYLDVPQWGPARPILLGSF